jgi:1,4-alpha-glucan branching enzyme
LDDNNLKYHFLADFDIKMLDIIKQNYILEHENIRLVHENVPQKVIAFIRNEILFVFNFSPNDSFQDYAIQTDPGKYEIILNTDSKQFGGNGFVDETMTYFTTNIGTKKMINNILKLYIPARCGIVLKKIPSKSVYDL